MMSVRVEGMQDIIAKVREMMQVTRADVVVAALEAGGEIIAEEARRLVPVRTGNLRDSIVVSAGGLNSSSVSLSKGQIDVQIGPQQSGDPNGFYGHIVEFGTYRSAPHPFMRPAFDSMSAEAASVVTRHLGAEFLRLTKG